MARDQALLQPMKVSPLAPTNQLPRRHSAHCCPPDNTPSMVSTGHCLSYSSFIQVVCLTTGSKPLPKRALHIVQSRASSFKWKYSLLSLKLSNSFLRLLPCLPVTSIPPFILPSITRCRRQFLRKMWPIQFAFRLCISCRIFPCSLTLTNTSSFLTWSVQLSFSILLQHHISKLSRCFWSVQVSAPYKAMLQT